MTERKNPYIATPVGRLVQGSATEPQTKDMEGRPLLNKDGTPRVQYFIAVAFEKTNTEFAQLWQQIQAKALEYWPNGQTQQPTFAWKLADGDAAENANKQGFKGCYVLRFQGGFPIQVVDEGNQQMANPALVKRGYYVQVGFTVNSNNNANKPGLFLNPAVVKFRAPGEEIVSGPNAAELFGDGGALPAGAGVVSSTSMPSVPGAAPGAVPDNNTNGAIMPTPGVTGAPPSMPGTPPIPAAQEPVKTMTQKANGIPYEQWVAPNGQWTDEKLIEHGYMVLTAPGVQQDTGILPF